MTYGEMLWKSDRTLLVGYRVILRKSKQLLACLGQKYSTTAPEKISLCAANTLRTYFQIKNL